MSRRTRSSRRAAIGGSLVLLAVALVVTAFGSGIRDGGEPELPPVADPERIVLFDSDAHGAVYTRGTELIGADAAGRELWRHRLGEQAVLPYAVCLERCPAATVGIGRSGSMPPDRPDAARLTFRPPTWRAQPEQQRYRVDRPLLPGARPLRLTISDDGRDVALMAEGRPPEPVPSPDLVPALAPGRAAAVLVGPRHGSAPRMHVLRRAARGWSVSARISLRSAPTSVCIAGDGRQVGLVGGGMPRRVVLRDASERPVEGAVAEEDNAGMCALAGDTFVTGILRSGDAGADSVLTIHRGSGRREVRLPAPFPTGVWVSGQTGSVAVHHEQQVLIFDRKGGRKRIDSIRAAAPASDSELRLMPVDAAMRVQSY